MELRSHTIDELSVGQRAFTQKTITDADILMFAAVSTDNNPAHINEEYARQTVFKRRIAHGFLTAGILSAVLGQQLPGPGCVFVGSTLRFKAPVYAGDTILAVVEVKEIVPEKNRVVMRTYAKNQDGVIVVDGEATLSPQKKKHHVEV
jgi:3-hydroxybutyryl-CoA dehydratase